MQIDTDSLFGLTTKQLVTLPCGHLIHQAVEKPLMAMQQAANRAGFDLQIVSSHRNFERQKAIWDGKFGGQRPILDADGHRLDIQSLSDWQICQAILLYSALPGASRHHWGTDLDFYDAKTLPQDHQLQLIAPEYQQQGPCAALTEWLQTHASDHGFFFPYHQYQGGVACEPWHLSHRPTSQLYLQALTLTELKRFVERSQIAGKDAIINNLQHIYENYITNIFDN